MNVIFALHLGYLSFTIRPFCQCRRDNLQFFNSFGFGNIKQIIKMEKFDFIEKLLKIYLHTIPLVLMHV